MRTVNFVCAECTLPFTMTFTSSGGNNRRYCGDECQRKAMKRHKNEARKRARDRDKRKKEQAA